LKLGANVFFIDTFIYRSKNSSANRVLKRLKEPEVLRLERGPFSDVSKSNVEKRLDRRKD
jgi:hypothetical protein